MQGMNHKTFGIFGKVFFYTVFVTIIVISIAAIFFAGQITSVFETTQRQQLTNVFQPLLDQLSGKSDNEKIKIAEEFHEKNASFEFCIETNKGRILYKTEKFIFMQTPNIAGQGRFLFSEELPQNKQYHQYSVNITNDVILYMSSTVSGTGIYDEAIYKTVSALLLLFIASMIVAALFARKIAKPIKRIAFDTKKMSALEYVAPPIERYDEIGQLAGDVYKMYDKLKLTIRQLENEIEREKEMEESQRYFFSVASHELKTPIAATCALLEGMLENVIETSEYPGYLRECMKMMTEQNKLVSEILEIVQLSDNRLVSNKETIDLNKTIMDILPTYQTLADAKGQNIIVEIKGNSFCTLDVRLFSKVLTNIFMNAVQNTPEQGEIRIFTEKKEGGTIRLNILNTNTHIADEVLDKLFDPFYREDKARSRGQGHSGLGLTIVKKALDLMELDFSLVNTKLGVLFWMDLSCT
jgi:two-component system sensor histidine kinase VanS